MLSSHELAKILLAHRDTDVAIHVFIEEYGEEIPSEELAERKDRDSTVVHLRDHPDEFENQIESKEVVRYNPTMDSIVIYAGAVTVIQI